MVTAKRLGRVGPPLAVGVVAAALCIWRLMPGVGLWDTAEFQTIPPILGTAHPTGYPTYVILGWFASIVLTPFGEAALRMNLLSALLVGAALALTVDLVRTLTGSSLFGVVAGLGLATTPIVWEIGTHADPHALHLALVAAIFWLLVRWERARGVEPSGGNRWLVAAAAVTGLAAGNHSLTLLLVVPLALFILSVDPRIVLRGRLLAVSAAALVIPIVIAYLELPLRGGAVPALRAPLVYGMPATWDGFTYIVTAEQFRGAIVDPLGDLPGKAADLAARSARELGALALFVLPGLFVTAVRFRIYALLSGSALAITCFFNAAYLNAEIERYYLVPVLIAWTWLAVLGATAVDLVEPGLGDPDRAAPDRTAAAAAGLAAAVLLVPTGAAFPARAAAVDRSGDRIVERWLDDVLGEVEPGAVVLSWWSYSTPLWYAQQIQGRRPDIFVVDDRTRLDRNMGDLTDVIDGNLGVRPVYAIRIDTRDLELLARRYTLTPLSSPLASNVLRVTAREAAGR
jgi:hypothetical protein